MFILNNTLIIIIDKQSNIIDIVFEKFLNLHNISRQLIYL